MGLWLLISNQTLKSLGILVHTEFFSLCNLYNSILVFIDNACTSVLYLIWPELQSHSPLRSFICKNLAEGQKERYCMTNLFLEMMANRKEYKRRTIQTSKEIVASGIITSKVYFSTARLLNKLTHTTNGVVNICYSHRISHMLF